MATTEWCWWHLRTLVRGSWRMNTNVGNSQYIHTYIHTYMWPCAYNIHNFYINALNQNHILILYLNIVSAILNSLSWWKSGKAAQRLPVVLWLRQGIGSWEVGFAAFGDVRQIPKDGQQTIAVPFVDVVLRAAKHANIYKPTSASGTTKFCKIQQS